MKKKRTFNQKKEQKTLSGKSKLLSGLLKVLVTVMTLWLMIPLLTGCAATANYDTPRETCRRNVVTYGDVVECMIRLDEAQAR